MSTRHLQASNPAASTPPAGQGTGAAPAPEAAAPAGTRRPGTRVGPEPLSAIGQAPQRQRSGAEALAGQGQAPADVTAIHRKALDEWMAAQQGLLAQNQHGQIASAEIKSKSQIAGAVVSAGVQTVTDLAHVTRDAVKAIGDAFQKSGA